MVEISLGCIKQSLNIVRKHAEISKTHWLWMLYMISNILLNFQACPLDSRFLPPVCWCLAFQHNEPIGDIESPKCCGTWLRNPCQLSRDPIWGKVKSWRLYVSRAPIAQKIEDISRCSRRSLKCSWPRLVQLRIFASFEYVWLMVVDWCLMLDAC